MSIIPRKKPENILKRNKFLFFGRKSISEELHTTNTYCYSVYEFNTNNNNKKAHTF